MQEARYENSIQTIAETLETIKGHDNFSTQQFLKDPWDDYNLYRIRESLSGRYHTINTHNQLLVAEGYSFPSDSGDPNNFLGNFALLLILNPNKNPYPEDNLYFVPATTDPQTVAAEGIYRYLNTRNQRDSNLIRRMYLANMASWSNESNTELRFGEANSI